MSAAHEISRKNDENSEEIERSKLIESSVIKEMIKVEPDRFVYTPGVLHSIV